MLEIEAMRPAKNHFVARLSGIRDRAAAERLVNVKLYVPRDRLPEPVEDDEFYHADLIGLTVVDRAGERLGTVVAIHNFGAGDLIEVQPDAGGKTELVAVRRHSCPERSTSRREKSSSIRRKVCSRPRKPRRAEAAGPMKVTSAASATSRAAGG